MGNKQLDRKKDLIENWYWYLTGENKDGFSSQYEAFMKRYHLAVGLLPGKLRCIDCHAPMSGLGSWLIGTHPASYSPRLCNNCEQALRKEEAGAEAGISLLFADVRGSTTLAEATTPSEFKALIQKFYRVAADILIRHDALVNRLMGDQVIGLFVPHFAGPMHAGVAMEAAIEILHATGHGEPGGPWIPVGIGIHTGIAYVGAVGTGDGVNEIAVLGSAPNLAARLSSQALDGEVVISEEALAASGRDAQDMESRQLDLKGINRPVAVRVLRVGARG